MYISYEITFLQVATEWQIDRPLASNILRKEIYVKNMLAEGRTIHLLLKKFIIYMRKSYEFTLKKKIVIFELNIYLHFYIHKVVSIYDFHLSQRRPNQKRIVQTRRLSDCHTYGHENIKSLYVVKWNSYNLNKMDYAQRASPVYNKLKMCKMDSTVFTYVV